jgi:hypothetical protein
MADESDRAYVSLDLADTAAVDAIHQNDRGHQGPGVGHARP